MCQLGMGLICILAIETLVTRSLEIEIRPSVRCCTNTGIFGSRQSGRVSGGRRGRRGIELSPCYVRALAQVEGVEEGAWWESSDGAGFVIGFPDGFVYLGHAVFDGLG